MKCDSLVAFDGTRVRFHSATDQTRQIFNGEYLVRIEVDDHAGTIRHDNLTIDRMLQPVSASTRVEGSGKTESKSTDDYMRDNATRLLAAFAQMYLLDPRKMELTISAKMPLERISFSRPTPLHSALYQKAIEAIGDRKSVQVCNEISELLKPKA